MCVCVSCFESTLKILSGPECAPMSRKHEQRGTGRGREWMRSMPLEYLWIFMNVQHNITNGFVFLWLSRVQTFTFSPIENWRCVICLCSVISVPTNGIIPFPSFTSRRRAAVVFQADVQSRRTFLIAFWCK